MADIGKPLRRYKVIPLTEPVVPTREPPQRTAPGPTVPVIAPHTAPSRPLPASPQRAPATQPAEPERA